MKAIKKEDAVKRLIDLYEGAPTPQDILYVKCKIEQEGVTDEARGDLLTISLAFSSLAEALMRMSYEVSYEVKA